MQWNPDITYDILDFSHSKIRGKNRPRNSSPYRGSTVTTFPAFLELGKMLFCISEPIA